MQKIKFTEVEKTNLREQLEHYLENPFDEPYFKPELAYDLTKIVKPEIRVNAIAFQKISKLVEKCDKNEVAFHGLMRKEDTGIFSLYDILVYPQKVQAAYVDVDEQEYSKWQDELDDETFNAIRCQIHSHVNMAPTPSSTDKKHYENIASQMKNAQQNPFYFFWIVNKRGESTAIFYDFEQNIKFEHADIKIKLVDNEGNDIVQWAKTMLERYVKQTEPIKTSPVIPRYNYWETPGYKTYGKQKDKPTQIKEDDYI